MKTLSRFKGGNPSAEREDHIDLLRGLAIVMILILHAGAMVPGIQDRYFLHIVVFRLSVGMQLFFVLSGYLISHSWERLRQHPNALAAYAIRRSFKIAPLYLLFLHLYIIAYLLFFKTDPSHIPETNRISADNLTWGNYLMHILFAQGVFPNRITTLVDGGWSVVAEVYFYILYPLLITKYSDKTFNAFKSYLFTLSLAIVVTELVTGRMEDNFGYRNFIAQLPSFMLGVLVFRVLRDKSFESALERWAPSLLAFAIILGIGMINGNLSPVGSHNIYALIFALILISLSRLPGREIWTDRLTALRIMGKQSYALFFVHIFLLKLQTYYLVNRLGEGHFWEILGLNLVTSILVSFLVSAVLVHPIDQYFVRLSSRIAGGIIKRSSN